MLRIAESYGTPIFSFLSTFILFSIMATPIYILISSVRVLFFPTPSLGFIIFRHFNSDWFEVTPHYSFDVHLSNN